MEPSAQQLGSCWADHLDTRALGGQWASPSQVSGEANGTQEILCVLVSSQDILMLQCLKLLAAEGLLTARARMHLCEGCVLH